MKSLSLFLCLWGMLFSSISYAQTIDAQVAEVLLSAHQQKSEQPLQTFYHEHQEELTDYWKAYLLYRRASFIDAYEAKRGEAFRLLEKTHIEKAIQLSEKKADKEAEDWVLLALCESYAMKFSTSKGNAYQSATKISQDLDQAFALDPANPRGFLVKALQDAHTPAMYGGGRKAQAYFEQAIALFAQAPKDSPVTWGYEDSYRCLAGFYNNRGEQEKAQETLRKASVLFPQNEQFINTENK